MSRIHRAVRGAACCLASLLFAAPGVAAPANSAIPGQYIVTVDRPVLDRTLGRLGLLDAAQTLLAGVGGGQVLMVYEHALPGFAVRMSAVQAALLAALPGVRAVEADRLMWLSATQSGARYHLDRLDQRDLPLDNGYTYPDSAGSGVHVYVIDTGINASHVDFSGRIGQGRNFAANSQGLLGPGPTDPNNTADCQGHGTHVSGLAAGSIYGSAKRATLHPVRVFSCSGSTSSSLVIAGMDWVLSNHVKPAVVNLSVGGDPHSATDTAVRNLINAGIATVVAAGNETDNACNYSPSREPLAITVGSTTSSDARSSFSNFGACVDLFAPGSSIVSAGHRSSTGTATMSGTSMASPITAGAAAIYLGQNPGALPAQVRNALVADATPNRIADAAGSPNLLLHVADAGGGAPPPADQVPVARFTFSCNGLTCSFNGSSSSDDKGIAAYAWNFGDGSGGNGAQVSRSYAVGGSYPVTLTVTDTVSQTDTETQNVAVNAPASAPCSACTRYTGSLAAGGSTFHPGSGGYSSNGGLIRGYLLGPAGADYELTLQKRSGNFLITSWTTVAVADGAGASETLVYNGSAGVYRFRVRAKTGSGAYEFYLEDP